MRGEPLLFSSGLIGVEFDNTPYPAGMRRLMMTFSLGPRRVSSLPATESIKNTARFPGMMPMKEISVEGETLVMPVGVVQNAGLPLFLAASLASSNVRFPNISE